MPYNGKRWSVGNAGQGAKESRSDTGNNHPETALLLLGHGGEGLAGDTVVIPPGTIVMVKSHSGDVRIFKDLTKDLQRLYDKSNTDYLLDPVKYIEEITTLFGSVAIYREGDVCPNLINSRFISWDYPDRLRVIPSGLIKLPLEEDQTTLNRLATSEVNIPQSMTIGQYFQQRDEPGGVNINTVFRLAVTKNLKPFLPELEKYLAEELRLGPERLLVDGLKNLEQDTTTDVRKMLKSLKAPTVLYFFTCRYMDGHESYVPESVRLGTNATNTIITNRVANRQAPPSGQNANNTHLKQYLRAIGKTSTLKADGSQHLVTDAAMARAVMGFRNRNSNTATRRARVSRIAPEIQQQISESVLQRRLGAKAYANVSRRRGTNNPISIYNDELTHRTAHKDKLNRLKRSFPRLENDFVDKWISVDLDNMSPYVRHEIIEKLRAIKNSYPERAEEIDAATKRAIAANAAASAAEYAREFGE
uniref:Uncharacterized protein n=1 Tax=viral metagenome TaxID=1070528 RepID=A0A6C0DSL0_9ZZZZ